MDAAELAKVPGALTGASIIGFLWGIYYLYTLIRKQNGENNQREAIDAATLKTLSQLQQIASDNQELMRKERERADGYAGQMVESSRVAGRLEAELKYSNERVETLSKEIAELKETVKALVTEARNKDRSIAELGELSRRLLSVMDATTLGEPLPPGITNVEQP